LKSYC